MLTIVGISGSTRGGSFNASLLRALAAAAPQDAQVRIESIAAIPLYNGDEEAEHGVPQPVARLKEAIAAADALLLVTPEYNSSIPGVAKNAIDWCSRPPADVPRIFRDKPVAIAGASPGKLLVSRAGSVFDANGNITDAAVRESVGKFMAGFVAFIRS